MGKIAETAKTLIQLILQGETQTSPIPQTFFEPSLQSAKATDKKFLFEPPTVQMVNFGNSSAELEKKADITLLRNYAKHSTWVRAALDYQRRMIGRAKFEIVPIDSTQKISRADKFARQEIEKLLNNPNETEESYGNLKEQFLEDYFVIGHGVFYLDLYNDLTVRGIQILDAARIGFLKNWDGTDRARPRYVEFKDNYSPIIKRFLPHEAVMCLVNRPMSSAKIGFSHVEALHRSVMALLSGDEYLLKQLIKPIPDSVIALGEGTTQAQADAFKYQLMQVRDKLAVISGTKDVKSIRLSASADEMKILDGQMWFVRHVASIFGMSTAKLKLSVDTSRANTESMMDDDLEAVEGDLTRLAELENAVFIKRYSYTGNINLQFSYPIMHRKDERQQAEIAKLQMGEQGWGSWNETRTRTGEKALDVNKFPYADEPIVNTPIGPLPYSVWVEQVDEFKKNIGKESAKPIPSPNPSDKVTE